MDFVTSKMTSDQSDTFLTPLNILILSIALYAGYVLFRGPASAAASATATPKPTQPPARVFRTFTPHTLLPFNGEEGQPIYFAVRGRVFDVSPGRNFYGPGGPYSNFAGRDASRGLACQSFDEDMLTKDLDGRLDPLDDLTADQVENLQGWEERFLSKYDVVGKLVSVADFAKGEKADGE